MRLLYAFDQLDVAPKPFVDKFFDVFAGLNVTVVQSEAESRKTA